MEQKSNRPAVKVCLVGNSGAGKTSLAQRFVYNKFNLYSESTIGASFFTKTMAVNTTISEQDRLELASRSDFSGEEKGDIGMEPKIIKFHGTLQDERTPSLWMCILCPLLNQNSTYINYSFLDLSVWDTAGQEKYQSLAPLYYRGAIAAILVYDICNSPSYDALTQWLNRLKEFGPKELIKIIVGNKCDLQEQRQVMKGKAELFAMKENCLYLETSARDNVNVEQIFHEIGNLLPEDSTTDNAAVSNGQGLRLDETTPSIRQRCGC